MTTKRFAQQFIFPNPSFNLIGPIDQFHFHLILPVMPDKAVFVSSVLLYVQRYLRLKLASEAWPKA